MSMKLSYLDFLASSGIGSSAKRSYKPHKTLHRNVFGLLGSICRTYSTMLARKPFEDRVVLLYVSPLLREDTNKTLRTYGICLRIRVSQKLRADHAFRGLLVEHSIKSFGSVRTKYELGVGMSSYLDLCGGKDGHKCQPERTRV